MHKDRHKVLDQKAWETHQKNKQILAPTGYTSVRMQADFMRLIWDIFQFF
jgi:hypothetical protein